MSNEEKEPVATESAANQAHMSPAKRMVVLAVVFFLLLMVVIFSGNVRTRAQVTQERMNTARAISKALVDEVIQGETGRLRLSVETIAKEAGYASMTVTDKDGLVLATTDRTVAGQIRDEMKNPKPDPVSVRVGGLPAIRKAIVLGENNIQGNLEIVFKK